MADKLKVEELRTELAQRGLSTAGTKPSLVLPRSVPHTHSYLHSSYPMIDFLAGPKTRNRSAQRKQAASNGYRRW